MAYPIYVGTGPILNVTTGGSATFHASTVDGDLLLLVCETSNDAVTLATGGWTQISASPQGTGTAGTSTATRLTVFWKIRTGGETSVAINDPGDHLNAGVHSFRGFDSANPFNVQTGDVQASSTTAVVCPSVTTTVDECLICLLVADGTDLGAGANRPNGFANANLNNLIRRNILGSSTGLGGGLTLATGEKATAGSTGTTTATMGASHTQARITLALAPLVVPPEPKLFLGSNPITAMYVGSAPVTKVYLGETLIWP